MFSSVFINPPVLLGGDTGGGRGQSGIHPAQLWLDKFQHDAEPDRSDPPGPRNRGSHSVLCIFQCLQWVSSLTV